MAFRKQLPVLTGLVILTFLNPNLLACATGGWTHFVQQEIDVNNPNSHGVGSLLSTSQQQQLTTLDDDVSALEDQVSQAINSGQVNEAQASDLRTQLGKIESRQTDILTSAVLSYDDAEGLLLAEQKVKATLKAAMEGRSKPVASDYFDSKDAYAFRDHLLRKLYYYRTTNALSANEYDELRSHVEHVGQRLEKEGSGGAHDSKLLKRMHELEQDINRVVNGGADEPPPAPTEGKKKKQKKATAG